jgi:hypothetical protein
VTIRFDSEVDSSLVHSFGWEHIRGQGKHVPVGSLATVSFYWSIVLGSRQRPLKETMLGRGRQPPSSSFRNEYVPVSSKASVLVNSTRGEDKCAQFRNNNSMPLSHVMECPESSNDGFGCVICSICSHEDMYIRFENLLATVTSDIK